MGWTGPHTDTDTQGKHALVNMWKCWNKTAGIDQVSGADGELRFLFQ